MMRGLLPHYPSVTMIAATPDGAHPWRIGHYKFKKKLPARCASERPSGKGDPLVDDFHGTGMI
jgi:hypothetical protein